jgi:pyruvate ferredoxin oxidoreductase gamma subunit
VIEIRWHARAGQGAKTASQIFALAMLRHGKHVQAFPEYGPERRGAPVRAFTRIDEKPIRRHDAVEAPDIVVVLEPSLLREAAAGLASGGLLLANTELSAGEVQSLTGAESRVVALPASSIAEEAGGRFATEVMLGALAGALGAPTTAELVAASCETLGSKVSEVTTASAIAAGRRLTEEAASWAA